MTAQAAIILAAENTSLFGSPKQLLEYQGGSLLRRAVNRAEEAGCDPVIVVVGANASEMIGELKGTRAIPCFNPRWESGMGSSIKAALRILEDRKVDGTLLMGCDQICVDAACLTKLMAEGVRQNIPAAASAYEGALGVPAWFHRALFPELKFIDDKITDKALLAWLDKLCFAESFPQGAVTFDSMQLQHAA